MNDDVDLVITPRDGGYSRGRKGHEQILRAALELVVEHGYQAITMRRVAAASGIKLGNLTYYFPTREDLIRELLDAAIRFYEVQFGEIAEQPGLDPEDRLARVCSVVLSDLKTKKTTHLFPELWALSNHDPFVADRVSDLYTRARAPLLDVIEKINPALSESQRQIVAVFISGSMEGMTMFIGHRKPFESEGLDLQNVAIKAFVDLVKNLAAEDFDDRSEI